MFKRTENDDKLQKTLRTPFEKPNNLWSHIFYQINRYDNKYNLSQVIYCYLKHYSMDLLKKMKQHSEKFKIQMKDIVDDVK